jgi:hypothetical protein
MTGECSGLQGGEPLRDRLQPNLRASPHPQMPVPMARRLLAALAAATALHGAVPLPGQTCVAIGYGSWLPSDPAWLPEPWFRTPPHVSLQAAPKGGTTARHLHGWMRVGSAPDLGADTVWTIRTHEGVSYELGLSDVFGGWRAPEADSLELRRLAGLSWNVDVFGRWSGDTLRARAHVYSDVRVPEAEPRANAYGVRYACRRRAAAAAADRALRRLLDADRADTLRGRREAAESDLFRAGMEAAKSRGRPARGP